MGAKQDEGSTSLRLHQGVVASQGTAGAAVTGCLQTHFVRPAECKSPKIERKKEREKKKKKKRSVMDQKFSNKNPDSLRLLESSEICWALLRQSLAGSEVHLLPLEQAFALQVALCFPPPGVPLLSWDLRGNLCVHVAVKSREMNHVPDLFLICTSSLSYRVSSGPVGISFHDHISNKKASKQKH